MRTAPTRFRTGRIVLLAASLIAASGGYVPAVESVPPPDLQSPISAELPPPQELRQPNSIAPQNDGCLTPSQLRDVVPAIDAVSLSVLHGNGEPPKSCFSEEPVADCSLAGNAPRWMTQNDYHWSASCLLSNPLYFEDVSLERYGQVSCVQNALSGAKFFGTVAILPYKIGVDCPREHIYKLGYIRPGNCAPPVCEHCPISVRGCVLQAATVGGIGLLFP
jgi:hypothetical protein